ncbi:Flavonol reductase/cinnamoyl-CoA reductase [Handroanthus impetiginosus]|uniref:Flavonol reductase/cinnamoyl-CoA reductase n=1 Tax=Handroanthus impetiginosus TaxID=429701 RepID=A0A2G9I181_9LAMI|nr:Flavonol reductase/cinnamoyl-CoA reductase [Handroanthus impetiginosus]
MAPATLWNSPRTVCVMDASGRLGSALVHHLLHRGYAVHAAVHDPHELQRYERQSSENKNLRAFHSDPLDYHSIMDALKGCSALFYSFELPSDNPNYDELMGELEVRAAHNVLEACAQTDTIEKVVFTSSATAVVWRDHDGPPSSDLDERHWSDITFCKKFKLWHGLSKTLAEKTAWALAMDRGVNMVSINGGLLMRPDLNIKDPYLLGAAEMFKDGVFVTVDLKFLVDAHICVFEDPSSYGRYLCFNRIINCSKDVVKLATVLLPSSSPQGLEDNGTYQQRISNEKLRKLMVDFESRVQLD